MPEMSRNSRMWFFLAAFGLSALAAFFFLKGMAAGFLLPVLGVLVAGGLVGFSFWAGGHSAQSPRPATTAPAGPKVVRSPANLLEDLKVVREVGHYALHKELGRGAFGTVYKAVDSRSPERFWAIKEMELKLDSKHSLSELRKFFDQEQKVLSWLNHPGIVARRDFFTVGTSLYLVMEYVPGYTLRQVLTANRGAFLQDFVVGLAESVCEALAYLHSQRPNPIIFRDLKPGNLMLAEDGSIKLIDFGICRLSNQNQRALDCMPMQEADEVTEVLGRCQDTVCLGTPGYAAPEQYPQSGVQSDARADLFALGVLMWELLTDERPPRRPQRLERVGGYNATAHEELQGLLDRATALDRNERYSSAKLMARALQDFREKRICTSLEKLKADRQMAYVRTHNLLKTNFS
jgi:serine/threonine protein kinase